VDWPAYSPGGAAPIQRSRPAPPDLVGLLSAGYRWDRPTTGVLLTDLSRDGVVEPNLVWKDTVLVRTGQVVDILFDVTNPGLWMAHCHIAEHMQSGMMFSFNVTREGATKES
jgi:FtsP/CotA-like multicopper oxidase with cupredoxin domain